jgi:hypothetical protein
MHFEMKFCWSLLCFSVFFFEEIVGIKNGEIIYVTPMQHHSCYTVLTRSPGAFCFFYF